LRGDITNFGRLTTFSSFSHILFDDGDNAVTSLLNLAAESDGGEFIAKMRGWVILEGSNWRDTLSVSDKGVGRVIFRISDLSVDVLRSLVMKACIKDCESSFLELMKFTNFKEIDREEVIRMCREHNSSKVLGLMR
jgi:hypothetical protein